MFDFHIILKNVNIAKSSVNKVTDNRPLQNKTILKWEFFTLKNFLKLK